jgi:hypothetical protein
MLKTFTLLLNFPEVEVTYMELPGRFFGVVKEL